MSIASEIERINSNIEAAYDACDDQGAIMPQTQNSANLASTISGIPALRLEVVQTKPESNIKTNVIYLIPNGGSDADNRYDEWIYVDGSWELIGGASVDLSDYATRSEIPTSVSELQNDAGYVTQEELSDAGYTTIDEVLSEGFIYQSDLNKAVEPIRKRMPYIISMRPSGADLISWIGVKDIMIACFDMSSQDMLRPVYICVHQLNTPNFLWVTLDKVKYDGTNAVFHAHSFDPVTGTVMTYSKTIAVEDGLFALDHVGSYTLNSAS